MSEKEYDFVVIGGGSAGYAAARTAVDEGLSVAVIEGADEVGGLCILRGCMPSKTVIESANRNITLHRAREFGLRAENLQVMPREIKARKERLIGEFADYRKEQLESGKFDFIRGLAEFNDAHTLRVLLREGGEETVKGKYFLIATGSKISHIDIPGLREAGYMTSDDALDAEEIPESLIVLGGGAIAVEAAHHMSGLGARVTLIQRSAQVLKENDADLSDALLEAFRERGMTVYTDTSLQRVEVEGDRKIVVFEHQGEDMKVEADEILQALGREGNSGGMHLDAADVELRRDKVRIQATMQSTASHIFAAGDVCGPHEIVHIAIQQGEIAARNAARLLRGEGEDLEEMDYRLLLFAVFSEPQIAVAGMGEKQAKDAGIDFVSAKYPFNDHGKSMVMGEREGFVKLIADKSNGEIIGGSVVGPHASDLIHEVVVAMSFHSTAEQFLQIPHYHPTLSEIWLYPAEKLTELCDN